MGGGWLGGGGAGWVVGLRVLRVGHGHCEVSVVVSGGEEWWVWMSIEVGLGAG